MDFLVAGYTGRASRSLVARHLPPSGSPMSTRLARGDGDVSFLPAWSFAPGWDLQEPAAQGVHVDPERLADVEEEKGQSARSQRTQASASAANRRAPNRRCQRPLSMHSTASSKTASMSARAPDVSAS